MSGLPVLHVNQYCTKWIRVLLIKHGAVLSGIISPTAAIRVIPILCGPQMTGIHIYIVYTYIFV